MKKSSCLGTFTNTGLVADAPCGLSNAVFFASADDTEFILWDNKEAASGYELLHVYIDTGSFSFTPAKPKSCQNGIWLQLVKGTGGVTIDTEP